MTTQKTVRLSLADTECVQRIADDLNLPFNEAFTRALAFAAANTDAMGEALGRFDETVCEGCGEDYRPIDEAVYVVDASMLPDGIDRDLYGRGHCYIDAEQRLVAALGI